MPLNENFKCLIPSSNVAMHSALSFPFPKSSLVPTFTAFAFPTRASQVSFPKSLSNKTKEIIGDFPHEYRTTLINELTENDVKDIEDYIKPDILTKQNYLDKF